MKNLIPVVFSTGLPQPSHVGRTIACNGILPLFGVVQVHVRVVLADSLSGVCRPPHPLLGRGLNPRIVGRVRPCEGENNVEEWAIGRVESEGITARQTGSGGDGSRDGLITHIRRDTRNRKKVLEGGISEVEDGRQQRGAVADCDGDKGLACGRLIGKLEQVGRDMADLP